MKKIYLDNAATTKVDPMVFMAMKPYFLKKYGNASEFHFLGREAKTAIEEARGRIALFLGAKPGEIFFTGSATESINLSHKGLIEALRPILSGSTLLTVERFAQGKLPHIITSQIEHKAVLETCKHLGKLGLAEATYLPVDRYGVVDIQEVKKAICPETALISLMSVNNEVGTIEPIKEVGLLVKKVNNSGHRKIFFHTDATQAIQYLDCNVDRLGVDFLSLTGHKIYAPKGIGVLFVRSGTPLIRQLDGGGQESGLRASTENIPYIVGIAQAINLIAKATKSETVRINKLRDKLTSEVLKIPGVKLTGHVSNRIPHIASFIVDGVEGEAMVLALSDLGICVSSGSACTASDLSPSHVLTAMGIPPEKSHGSIRFSLGRDSKNEDIDMVIDKLPKVIKRLRKMAPKL